LSVPAAQAETAALLHRLSGAAPVETHISLVYRGADTVWKLKKAVRLPFLDFTQADARRRFAERELALNGHAAPGLYRDVVAMRQIARWSIGWCGWRACRTPISSMRVLHGTANSMTTC
jgi:aminoglycoside phosphotransferase family enzyme